MKIEIEIDEEKGCIECPFHIYHDNYDNYRYEDTHSGKTLKEGFYCTKCKMFITDCYNNPKYNGIVIPDWCPFKNITKQ